MNRRALGPHFLTPKPGGVLLLVTYPAEVFVPYHTLWYSLLFQFILKFIIGNTEIEFQCPDDDGFYAVPGKCVINFYICVEGNATLQVKLATFIKSYQTKLFDFYSLVRKIRSSIQSC